MPGYVVMLLCCALGWTAGRVIASILRGGKSKR